MATEEEVKLEWMAMYEDLDDLSFRHFPVLARFSADDNASVRFEAARLIAKYLNGKAKKVLLRLTQDEDLDVRDMSYVLLNRFLYDDVALFLKESMKKEENAHIRSNIIFSWATVSASLNRDAEEDLEFLLKRKFSEKDEECLLNCSYGQYLLGDKSVFKEIFAYLDSEDADIRDTALVYLGRIKDPENREEIKKAAIRLLETEDDENVRKRGEDLLNDISYEEKKEIFETFEQLAEAPDEYLPIFWKLSFDKDELIRNEVAKNTCEYVNEQGKEILLRLAQDEDEMVRAEAYDSLCRFPFEDAEIFLENAMQTETDDLARGYAILSWSEMVAALEHISVAKIELLQKITEQESDDCNRLECSYARYTLTDEESDLYQFLDFFRHESPIVRCEAAKLLKELIYDDNAETIKTAVTRLLKEESSAEVRKSAIGVLADYSYAGTVLSLQNAIILGQDELKRSYALCSWADIAATLGHYDEGDKEFIREQKERGKSLFPLLSCCYAQYVLGDEDALDELLVYLQDKDAAVRRDVLDLLEIIVTKDNREMIMKSLRALLEWEETVEVNDLARNLLQEIIDHR